MQLLDDLIAARALIKRGWTQGDAYRRQVIPLIGRDRYCLLGALQKATDAQPWGNSVMGLVPSARTQAVIDCVLPALGGIVITRWNDKEHRRKWEVLDLLDTIIADLGATQETVDA